MSYENIYFIGIGGIGMSAIARWCRAKGYAVSGYDRTPSELTHKLEDEGISVHYEDDCSFVPEDVEKTLVVYTPAVSADFGELRFVRERGYKLLKRAQLLGVLTSDQTCLAVAGTHGKTTTSTLLAHILRESGEDCSAFLGGISKNYGTNVLIGKAGSVVVEADEYDRSFLQLHPAIAAITAMDADHLDIYGDLEHVQAAFRQFAAQVSGTVVAKYGLPLGSDDTRAKIVTYHLSDERADFHASNLRLAGDGHYVFDLVHPGGVLSDIRVGALGWVNVENSIAAAAVCLCYGVDAQRLRAALGSFEGVRRRLDLQVDRPGLTYIDDYAHHPSELQTAISSLRQIFPGRKLCGVFQPHLYTRTRDFASEFAQALSGLDKLILLDIYPAREEPIEGVSSEMIMREVACAEKVLLSKDELLSYLGGADDLDVLVTLGAGDIDRFVSPIRELLG